MYNFMWVMTFQVVVLSLAERRLYTRELAHSLGVELCFNSETILDRASGHALTESMMY